VCFTQKQFQEIQMKRTHFVVVAIAILFIHSTAPGQSQDPPKFEVAGEFTTLERDANTTEPGFGGRFTYNLNRIFAIEAAGYFFPRSCFDCRDNGRATEALGGVKVGRRFGSWGLFGKARPGVVSFSAGNTDIVSSPNNPAFPGFPFRFETSRATHFATDIGGALEFYPSKRIVTRFDAGDTIIHYGSRTSNFLQFDGTTNTYTLVPFTIGSRTTHNFQFMASVGFRF
jgi:hypothetical protein